MAFSCGIATALRKIGVREFSTERAERSSKVSAVSTRGDDVVELEVNAHSAASIVIL